MISSQVSPFNSGESRYRFLIEHMRQGFCIIEKIAAANNQLIDFRYIEVNPAFERHTGMLNATGKTIRELVPDAEQTVIDAYNRVASTGVAENFETHIKALDIWMDAEVFAMETPGRIAVLFRNITDQKTAETALQRNNEQQGFLLKLSDALRPLSNPEAIKKVAATLIGEQLKLNRAFYADIENNDRIVAGVFEQGVPPMPPGRYPEPVFNVWGMGIQRSGQPVIINNSQTDTRFSEAEREAMAQAQAIGAVTVSIIKEGQLVGHLVLHQAAPRAWTAEEITLAQEAAERTREAIERALAEASLKESENRFRSFVAVSSDLIYRVSHNWKEMYLLNSGDMPENTWQSSRNWMNKYIPKREHARILATIEEAIDGKKIFDLEHQVIQADRTTGWVHSRAAPVFDADGQIKEWRGSAQNITSRKEAIEQLINYKEKLEQEVIERTAQLRASQTQLQSVFNTTLVQFSMLEAIRDEQGRITDFEIKLVNHELEKVTGCADLIGKRYTQEYPGVREVGIFDLMVKTVETGEPQLLEYYFPHNDINRWFSSMFVKLNDGVVASNTDITARIQAEDERLRNYLLLQQSEDMAQLGSWDYNVLNGNFTWSDGMYRLFDLKKGTEIEPEIYLAYTTEASRPAAERVVKHIRQGHSDFAETLEIKVKGKIKILHLKATVIKNHEGNPVRVLGVDMDITATNTINDQLKKMEAEQQIEIFRVSLSTLEEERRRISENLHNGLGQLLYGVSISLANLTKEVNWAEFEDIKAYTQKLLSEAIRESRRISHELMPAVLEEFGLKAAIDDMCQQLQDGTAFSCRFTSQNMRLEKYLELAVYRTVQELTINVVKHAKATKAVVTIAITASQVKIKVSDNGQGIAPKAQRQKTGIGLASIRSKIKLLNGQVKIASSPSTGTTASVLIPLSVKATSA